MRVMFACLFLAALAPSVAVAQGPTDVDPRLRFGAEGGLGLAVDAPYGNTAGSLQVHGRMGVQVSPLLGVYAYGGAFSLWNLMGANVHYSTLAAGVGADLTVDDRVQLGLGVGGDLNRIDQGPLAVHPAALLRLAYLFGRRGNDGARRGFVLALTQYVTFIPERAEAVSRTVLSGGFELY